MDFSNFVNERTIFVSDNAVNRLYRNQGFNSLFNKNMLFGYICIYYIKFRPSLMFQAKEAGRRGRLLQIIGFDCLRMERK